MRELAEQRFVDAIKSFVHTVSGFAHNLRNEWEAAANSCIFYVGCTSKAAGPYKYIESSIAILSADEERSGRKVLITLQETSPDEHKYSNSYVICPSCDFKSVLLPLHVSGTYVLDGHIK